MAKFDILCSTINGEILENESVVSLDCDLANYVGIMNVRAYDANDCIVVKRVFVIRQGNTLFGTHEFKSIQDFLTYRDLVCFTCLILFNGCYVTFNGDKIRNELQ